MKPQYFTADEFHGDYDKVNKRLLVLLDVFRFQWGDVVKISPAPGAVARKLGPTANSDHNVDKWGEVRAVDVLPAGMLTPKKMREAFELARSIGFTAIGVYPDWKPQPGLHLAVREGLRMGSPATWAGVRQGGVQVYVGVERAFG